MPAGPWGGEVTKNVLSRFVINRDGNEIALEPYENDRWELTVNGEVVHVFFAERLNLKELCELLVRKGHLSAESMLGMTRIADWKAFDILPPPEGSE